MWKVARELVEAAHGEQQILQTVARVLLRARPPLNIITKAEPRLVDEKPLNQLRKEDSRS